MAVRIILFIDWCDVEGNKHRRIKKKSC